MKSQDFGAPETPESPESPGDLGARAAAAGPGPDPDPDTDFGPDFAPAPDGDESPLSLRRERFCRAYARHGNAARAAREAGYAPAFAKQRGHRLLEEDTVRARVAEIAGALDAEAMDAAADPRRLMAKLEAVYRHALGNGAFNAAARAVELQARLGRQLAAPAGAEKGDETEDLDAIIARAEAAVRRFDFDAEESDPA